MKIIDNLIQSKGLLFKVFGSFMQRQLFYDIEVIQTKQILKNTYGIKDIDSFFPDILEKRQVEKNLKILYQYSGALEEKENNNNGNG